jgi:hypothetical protein
VTDGATPKKTAADAARDFVEKSGFPLEMEVARTFKAMGWTVEQARQYIDAEEGKLRDLDVLAFRRGPGLFDQENTWKELRLVFECKRSETPWVLFIGDEHFTRSKPHFDTLDVLSFNGGILGEARDCSDLPIISHFGDLTYRVSNAAKGKDHFTWDAIRQVNSATIGLQRDFIGPEEYAGKPMVVVVVPVLVTDASLIECRLAEDGTTSYTETTMGLLVTRLRPEDRLHSVWIVNTAGLAAFAKLAFKTFPNMNVSV